MIPEKTLKTDELGQNETITVSKRALLDAVIDWERASAVQHLLLERYLKQLEDAARQCRNILAGCGVVQAKGALLALFLSDAEWDSHLRQGLLGEGEGKSH